MSHWLARQLYGALLTVLTPLYLLRLWWRGRREPAYRRRVRERLGFYRTRRRAIKGRVIWLHAVSLGETRAAEPLIAALRAHMPGMRLVLTCSTATGLEAGRALLGEEDVQTWLPYDTPGATRRFLRRYRPLAGVLMETEIWPNLLQAARQARLPIVLANARLSERSQRKGERFALLLRPAVQSLTRVLAQTDGDAQRLQQAGAPRVEVCGNLKYDVAPPPKLLARGLQWREPLNHGPRAVVLAASTREGEEHMLLAAWRALPAPRPLLLIVPRHPQRFNEVALLVDNSGFTLARRSSWGDTPPAEAAQADVWLGDSMGEMPLYYALADVALLGGSFAPLGGQNLIEAAACGCPVVMGPHTFNFDEAAELSLRAGASVRVAEMSDGVQRAAALASDPQRNAWVQNAFEFAAAHRGATERMARRIIEVVIAGRPPDA
ncbi:lipid IV(A) 3-deoxy-D-manno-octulosonic acid transferase [Aquincola sp. MAHUQ-54]|uniref:3-deoxy-D-manno-octulosonic acid transferase n=1 Tax=Aquincola agrisoli TaxID=3119538 RepID=A0AAW9QE59_9BURK